MPLRTRLAPIVMVTLLLACSSDRTPARAAKSEPEAERDQVAHEAPIDVGDEPLHNGTPSLSALGEAVVDALASNDGRRLLALTVPQVEYERRLFAALVDDAKRRGMGPQLVWQQLAVDSRRGLATALSEHGGKGYAFERLESTDRQERGGLVVHSGLRLVVKDTEGATLELKILDTVVEHPASGTFSILTFNP